jgi:hypothetical protein
MPGEILFVSNKPAPGTSPPRPGGANQSGVTLEDVPLEAEPIASVRKRLNPKPKALPGGKR